MVRDQAQQTPTPMGKKGDTTVASSCDDEHLYKVGDHVEYHSTTHKQWMPAIVLEVNKGGQTFNLDVKKMAQPCRMRLAGAVGSDLPVPSSCEAPSGMTRTRAVGSPISSEASEFAAHSGGFL